VSSILNACANGGFKDPLLLSALSKEAAAFPAGTSLQHIACAANALVSLSLLLSSLKLSDTKVYEPYLRARLGTGAARAARRIPRPLSFGGQAYTLNPLTLTPNP